MGRYRRRWIQHAIKRPGRLHAWLKRNARKVAAATHSPVFTRSGEINTNTLKKFRHTQAYKRLGRSTKSMINLGIRLEGYAKHKKRRRR